jgi:predicted dehydrogenase
MKNIGLVGLGYIGKTHFDAYQHIENGRVISICTKNQIKDEEILSRYNGSFVTDYDDLISNKDIDIVDICLPTYLHEEYIIRAADAGKHIICEKPLTLTMDSANRIIHAVNKNNVKLFVGHVLRFWPEYDLIKSYSQTDKLKDIEIVHAKRLSQAPSWSNWFRYPEKSGGALFDLHLHDIDFVYYLLGKVDTVYSVGAKNGYGAWDHVMTTLVFKGKGKAFIEASHRMPMGFPFTMSLRAQSHSGTLDFQIEAGENIENIKESNNRMDYYFNHQKVPIEVELGDAFQNELSYFINCIEKNEENRIIPLDDVIYTLKLLKVIESSLETGKVIQVDN